MLSVSQELPIYTPIYKILLIKVQTDMKPLKTYLAKSSPVDYIYDPIFLFLVYTHKTAPYALPNMNMDAHTLSSQFLQTKPGKKISINSKRDKL